MEPETTKSPETTAKEQLSTLKVITTTSTRKLESTTDKFEDGMYGNIIGIRQSMTIIIF